MLLMLFLLVTHSLFSTAGVSGSMEFIGQTNGGAVCPYTVTYTLDHASGTPFPVRSFQMTVILNATGFYSTCNEWWDSECAPQSESGTQDAYFSFNGFDYTYINGDFIDAGPWYTHYPIGSPSNTMLNDNQGYLYWEYFVWSSDSHGVQWRPYSDNCQEYSFDDWNSYTVYCITNIVRGACTPNYIPFRTDIAVTITSSEQEWNVYYSADGICVNSFWIPSTELLSPVIMSNGNDGLVRYKQNGRMIDVTNQYCGPSEGCFFMRQTPNFHGAELVTWYAFWNGLGQGQRVQFFMQYQALPNDSGNVCVYFDYAGVTDYEYSASTVDFDSYYQVYCGPLSSSYNGVQNLTVDVPMTFGPASYETDFGYNGYDSSHILIINASPTNSFVILSYGINVMGYNDWSGCTNKRRRQMDTPIVAGPNYGPEYTATTLASWTADTTPTPSADISSYFSPNGPGFTHGKGT